MCREILQFVAQAAVAENVEGERPGKILLHKVLGHVQEDVDSFYIFQTSDDADMFMCGLILAEIRRLFRSVEDCVDVHAVFNHGNLAGREVFFELAPQVLGYGDNTVLQIASAGPIQPGDQAFVGFTPGVVEFRCAVGGSDGRSAQRGGVCNAAEDILLLAMGVDDVRLMLAHQVAQAQQDLEGVQLGFVQNIHGDSRLAQSIGRFALVHEDCPCPDIVSLVEVAQQGPELYLGAGPAIAGGDVHDLDGFGRVRQWGHGWVQLREVASG